MTLLSHGFEIHTIQSLADDDTGGLSGYPELSKKIFGEWVLVAQLQYQATIPTFTNSSGGDGGEYHNVSSSAIPEGGYQATFLGKLITALPLDCRDARTIMLGAMLDNLELAVALVCAKQTGDPFIVRGVWNWEYRHYRAFRD